jgi:hypothetical protein
MKMPAFWDVATSITLVVEAAGTSKKSVNFYQTTRRNKSEDNHL